MNREAKINWWENVEIISENKSPYRAILNDSKNIIKNLNGEWDFKYFKDVKQTQTDPENQIFNQSKWDKISVPGCWEMNGFGEPNYTNVNHVIPCDPPNIICDNPTGIYKREIELNDCDINGKRIMLRLHGLDSIAKIYINDSYTGLNKNARVTSEFDISKFVKKGLNKIQLIVVKFSDLSYMENQDMWRFGGIFRDVELVIEPLKGIQDIHVHTNLDYVKNFAKLNVNITSKEVKGKLILSSEGQLIKTVEFDTKISSSLAIEVHNVELWSSENPILYDLQIISGNNDIKMKVGFKHIEIKERKLLVNGVPIKLRGVNMHDFTPTKGRVITKEETFKNLMIMKSHNINAIRTSHYPKSYWFYEMCDELGFWVMDEADLESHGLFNAGNWCALAEDEDYTKHHIEKAKQMVLRDRNFVSIISFSLGNEAGIGKGFEEMIKFIKEHTSYTDIFTHYEGDYSARIADVSSNMYTWVEDTPYLVSIEKGAPKKADTARTLKHIKDGKLSGVESKRLLSKPHVECEYAHAMGNGAGSLKEYWDFFYDDDSFMGGFIWEWFDHGLKIEGRKDYQYGGDFVHEKNDSNFCIDGLLLPNMEPSPALKETKEVYSPIGVQIDVDKKEIIITNKYNFSQINKKLNVFIIQKSIKGKVLNKSKLEIPKIERLKPQVFKFPDLLKEAIILEVVSIDKDKKIVSKKSSKVSRIKQEDIAPLSKKVSSSEKEIIVSDDGTKFTIDKISGAISFTKNNKEILNGNLLNYWRPTIDNDRMFKENTWKGKFFLHLAHNRLISAEDISTQVQTKLEIITKTSCPNQAWGYETTYIYSFTEHGFDISLKAKDRFSIKMGLTSYPPVGKNDIKPNKNDFKPYYLPRIGFDFNVNKSYTEVNYLGLGPEENYPDSKEAASFGYYKSNIDKLWTDYVFPQENGNRQEVNKLELSDKTNKIIIKSKDGLGFNYSKYSQNAIDKATHPSELKIDGENHLSINYKNGPIGSEACGPMPLKEYLAKFEAFSMEYSIEFK